MRKKRCTAVFVATVLTTSLLAGCGGSNTSTNSDSSAPKESAVESSDDVKSGNNQITAVAMEKMAESAIVAVDDDSFTIGPWGGDSSVRDWTEATLWAHLAYRPFIGAMLEGNELELVAAKSVTKVDDTTYEVEIFDNITDSRGNAVKAADVVFSYGKLAELGYSTYISSYYESAEATDDYHVKLYLKTGGDGAIEEILCGASIVNQSWYERASEDEIQSNPATTGAYTVANIQTGASVTLQAREDYWKTEQAATCELQNVKKIVINCITEASMRAIALENKEVDMAEISATEVKRFEGNSDYNVTKYNNAMTDYLIFNTSGSSICADENVRKAIAYGFDGWTMFLGNGHNQGSLTYDVAPNLGPDYQDEWETEDYYSMNADKAKECYTAAGYDDGKLTIRLMVVAQAPQGPYQALQAMLIENGINLEILAYDRALWQQYIYDETQWDIAVSSATVRDFTTTYWNRLFSKENYKKGTQGFTEDDKLQELLKAATENRSAENMNAFHNYVTDNCYMIGLYNETKSIAAQSGLTDICLQKLNPVLNAMSFTEDYTSVAK